MILSSFVSRLGVATTDFVTTSFPTATALIWVREKVLPAVERLESNISVTCREQREDKDFFDITLACDDDQIQAHKVILSACSPFFRSVLQKNPHQHPFLYLKGVKYADLLAVLNFMYHGEVNVAQDELNSFLAIAQNLRVTQRPEQCWSKW